MFDYTKINSLINRAKNQFPINQARRASDAQRQVMFNDPRNSPSRSQFLQAYTWPLQNFAASNTYQTPAGLESRPKRPSQPSIVHPGPGSNTIQTGLPWQVQ